MITVGLVAVDANEKWIGGRYYLQHLVRCVAALPEHERVAIADVWWRSVPDDDPFAEVRPLLAPQRVIAPPVTPGGRALRKIRRTLTGVRDARDLFRGIDVLFPIELAANSGVPLAFWMPDFQPWRLPELFASDMRAWFDAHYSQNGAAAAVIVVSSNDGLNDLRRFFPQFVEKARVLHFCSVPTDDWWSADPETIAARYALPEKFFIVANQFSHHKNHRVVFEAVRNARDVTVVCTGSTYGFRGDDYFAGIQSFIRSNGLEERIRILGLIPRADQIALMRRSVAVLQPSRFEGWSTVVEDARTLAKPLLLSDIGVHREQSPPRSRFMPLDDANAWADAMIELWRDGIPGPNRGDEAAALSRLEALKLETGRTFVSIMREAVR